ncbi:hypothetical protein TNCV_4667291 [Trichonephila clavipes]|nr:hypothetical protein TNCV_4667291 [Trichonephila clavipes]
MSKKRATAEKVSAELNQPLDSLVSMILFRKHLHKLNIKDRAAISQPLVTDVNAKRRLQWCHTHKTRSIDKWKKVMWTDELPFTFSPTTGTSARLEDTCISSIQYGIDILHRHLPKTFHNISKKNGIIHSSKHFSALLRIDSYVNPSYATGGPAPY